MADYIPAAGGTWTRIPTAARTPLTNARDDWTTAYTNVKGPRTKVDTGAKNDAKKAAAMVLQSFVNQYLRFSPVTNEGRPAMGIPNKSGRPGPIQPPGDGPSYSVAQMGGCLKSTGSS
ncbi:MAG: hypothetical protein LBJ24_02840 [Treponema sp.]|jgi:hypothetical protein|nr:hypothetical protein [Treponema sp.]